MTGSRATILAATAAFGLGALATHAGAQPGPQVQVEHAAVRMVVVAEPRSDISVTVEHGPSRLPPLAMRREGGRIVVDGGLADPFGNDHVECVGGWSSRSVGRWFGTPVTHTRDDRAVIVGPIGRVAYGDLPMIVVHLPLDARIADEGAVWGQLGGADRLQLSTVGCGDWTVGPLKGRLDAQMTGSGDATVERAGEVHGRLAGSGDLRVGPVAGVADVSVAGSGDIQTGPVGGPVHATLSGSGDIDVARVQAPVEAHIASSGGVRIHSGYAPQVRVSVAGSGDFDFDGQAGGLSASVVGSGDVRVAHVAGPVSKTVTGSGEVVAGR